MKNKVIRYKFRCASLYRGIFSFILTVGLAYLAYLYEALSHLLAMELAIRGFFNDSQPAGFIIGFIYIGGVLLITHIACTVAQAPCTADFYKDYLVLTRGRKEKIIPYSQITHIARLHPHAVCHLYVRDEKRIVIATLPTFNFFAYVGFTKFCDHIEKYK